MARSYTVTELLAKLRNRGGYENSSRLTDAKLIDFLESALAELHDLLISKYGEDYFTTRHTEPLVVGTDSYEAPADVLKLLRIDLNVGGKWCRLRRLQIAELDVDGIEGYRLEGDDLYLQYTSGATSFRLIYVRSAPKLTTDAVPATGYVNEIDGYNGWEELLVLQALLAAKDSQDEPIGRLETRIGRLLARLEWAADGRNAGEPLTIQDIEDDLDLRGIS